MLHRQAVPPWRSMAHQVVCAAYGGSRPPPAVARDAERETAARQGAREAALAAQARERAHGGPASTPPPRGRADVVADEGVVERSVMRAHSYIRSCAPLALLFRLRPMLPALPPRRGA